MQIIYLSAGPAEEQTFLGYLDSVCDKLGFDYAAYVNLNPLIGATQGFVNYPDAWKRHYTDHGFHMIDPTLHAAARSIAPVDWDRLKQEGPPSRVIRDARDYGITDRGLTVAVRGPMAISACSA